jgi:DNA-binding Xre family transcriptional regulator
MNNAKAAGANQDTDTEIAARITHALIVRGIDKKSLAMRIGLSYSTLRRSLEQDRGDNRSFTFRELVKIAEVLNVQPSTLIPASFTEAEAA